IDGRIADAGGRSQWISGPEARDHVHWLRAGFDAIAVGGTTALMDNPQLTARGGLTPRKPPVRIVFDRRAMLNLGVSLVQTAREVPTWVMASPEAPISNVSVLEGNGVRVFRPETLAQAFAQLRLAGIQSLLCEGGGALGAKLLAEGLVDRLYWVQSPVWLGEGAVAAFAGIPASPLADAPRWVVVERRPLGSDTLLVLDRRLCLPES
ncbi:MAG TPA: RibD family protein, partial [Gemmatimonadales bacterium]|nr:RibD family protein [Gemmatimonadales bacterium]